MTSTLCPQGAGRRLQRNRASRSAAGTLQHLLECGPTSLLDQLRAEVLLERLVRRGGALSQDGVHIVRNVLDLHTGHGAIMALFTPKSKRATIGKIGY
jgi:hypothetical protein